MWILYLLFMHLHIVFWHLNVVDIKILHSLMKNGCLLHFSFWFLVSVDLREIFVYTQGLCWVVYSICKVFLFLHSISCGSTLGALEQICSDRTCCSVPFCSINYRQRPCSPLLFLRSLYPRLNRSSLHWFYFGNMC